MMQKVEKLLILRTKSLQFYGNHIQFRIRENPVIVIVT